MSGIICAFMAGTFISLFNMLMRHSKDANSRWIIVCTYCSACVLSIILGIVKNSLVFSIPIILIGITVGIFTVLLIDILAKALTMGSTSTTIAILNASTLIPSIIMFFVFGRALGYDYNIHHLIGSSLFLIGLFYSRESLPELSIRKTWFKLAGTIFCIHSIILTIYSFKGYLAGSTSTFLRIMTNIEATSDLFFVALFLSAAIFQYIKESRRGFNTISMQEVMTGVLAGALNMTSNVLLVKATQLAKPLEQAVIFPLFSVTIIMLSSLYGAVIYKENVAWKGSVICAIGIGVAICSPSLFSQLYNSISDTVIALTT